MKDNSRVHQIAEIRISILISAVIFSLFFVFAPAHQAKAQYIGGYIQDVSTGLTEPFTLNSWVYLLSVDYGDYIDLHWDNPSDCSSIGVYDETPPAQVPNPSFSLYNGQGASYNRYGPLYQTSAVHYISMICWHYDSSTHYVGVAYQVFPPGGACGTAQGVYSAGAPSSGLCSVGTAYGPWAMPACGDTSSCTNYGGGLWLCPYDYWDGEEWVSSSSFCSSDFTQSGWLWQCAGGNTANCTAPSQSTNDCAHNRDSSGNAVSGFTTYTSSPSGSRYKAVSFGNYCWGNSGGPNYFVPANSWGEFSAFWNAIPGLSGLFRIP